MTTRTASTERITEMDALARRRIAKFLARSEAGLGGPIEDLRDPETKRIAMNLVWERASTGSPLRVTRLERPALDKRILDSVVVECRVFFLVKEDCYLPSVVSSLRRLVGPTRAELLKPLKAHVDAVVRNGRLHGAQMHSGRLEMDNGEGPGRLLGSDTITMDYINGIALHEDEASRARLANVSDEEAVRFAVLLQLDTLLRVVGNVRAQIVHDIESQYFVL